MKLLSGVQLFVTPWTIAYQAPPWKENPQGFPGKNTGVGYHFLLQGRRTLTDIKGEIDSNTIIVGDFNTQLTPTDRSSKQKINKETHILNDTLDDMDLIDIFRTFHPNAEKYTFFSSAHGTFSKIDHILGHKSNLSKVKKVKIASSIFFDHNAMRLDINYKKKM